MSSALIKLGLLSLVSSALAAPVAQSAETVTPDTVTPNAWWSVPTVTTPSDYPTDSSTASTKSVSSTASASPSTYAVEAAAVTTTVSHSRWWNGFSKASSSSSISTAPTSTVSTAVATTSLSTQTSAPAASTTEAATTTKATTTAKASTTAKSSTTTKATKSSTSAAVSSSSSSGSKRGLPYNNASLTDCFAGSKASWAYNWASSSSGLNESAFEYVPQLWGTGSDFTSGWKAAVKTALGNGAKNLLAFNEPDLSTQSNLTPKAAADGYNTYMQPWASQARLGSPAVTNGGGDTGITWLTNFLDACTGCTVDFVAVHWYDSYSNVAYFKQHLTDAYNQTGKPVWLTEFGTTDGSDADISAFLEEVLPWMDEQDWIERYAYFMASDGKLNNGTEPSTYGKTYATV